MRDALVSPVAVSRRELAAEVHPVFHWIREGTARAPICGALPNSHLVTTNVRISTIDSAGRPCARCLRILGRLA